LHVSAHILGNASLLLQRPFARPRSLALRRLVAARSLGRRRGRCTFKFDALSLRQGNYTFFPKYFLENEIFLDNPKFLISIFLENDCIFLENAISFFLPRR
jgi:hypothetical protein